MLYADTEAGVRQLLKDAADESLEPVAFTPDPYVRGAWLVQCSNGVALLCYVGDHPYAGDFEEGDMPALKDKPGNDCESYWTAKWNRV